jgi:hypothetical protein
MKSENFSYEDGKKTVEFVVTLHQDKYNNYGLVTILEPDGSPLNIDSMPVHTLARVFHWIEENNSYML